MVENQNTNKPVQPRPIKPQAPVEQRNMAPRPQPVRQVSPTVTNKPVQPNSQPFSQRPVQPSNQPLGQRPVNSNITPNISQDPRVNATNSYSINVYDAKKLIGNKDKDNRKKVMLTHILVGVGVALLVVGMIVAVLAIVPGAQLVEKF